MEYYTGSSHSAILMHRCPAGLQCSLILLAALLVGNAVLFAPTNLHAGADSPTTQTTSLSVKQEHVITVWMMGFPAEGGDVIGGIVQAGMGDILRDFERRNPGMRVRYQDIGWEGALEKIMTSMISGGPDVYMLGTTWVGQFANMGTLTRLDDLAARDHFPFSDYFEEYAQIGHVPGFKEKQSHWYAMPFIADTRLLFYDKQIFDHYKVPYPHDAMSWQELKERAAGTTGVDPITGKRTYGYIIDGQDGVFQYMGFLYQNGGRFYNTDETRAALDEPKAIEALKFVSELETQHHVSGPGTGSYWTWNTMAPFASSENDMAMVEGVPSEIVDAVERNPQRYGVCTLPVGVTSGSLMGGSLLAINHGRTPQQLADSWEFVKFMASEPAQKFMLEKLHSVVPMKRIRQWSYVRDNPGWEVAMRQCSAGYNTPRRAWGTSYNVIKEEVQAAVTGAKSPENACRDMQKRVDAILAEEAPPPYTEGYVTRWFFVIIGIAAAAFIFFGSRQLRRAHPQGVIRDFRRGAHWYLFLLPGALLLLMFLLYPVLESLRLSLLSSDGLNVYGGMGLRNYFTILHNEQFWGSVYNTLCLTCAEIAVGMPLGVALAVLINEAITGKTFFKVVYFIPVVPALVAVAIAWTLLFRADERGILNSVLAHVGIKPVGWLADPAVTKLSIVLMDTWKGVGLVVIIVLAGLQAISPDLYEAARIDGADSWQRFRFVTLPMLRPTLTFLLITSTIGCLQMFDQLYTLGGATGGPQRSFQTMVVYLYETGFVNQHFGLASAVAYILFVLILLLTYVNMRLLKPRAEVDF